MTGPVIRRAVILLTAALVALSTALITPAWACGCGAYAPGDGGTATVPMETALVRVNADATEDIYLSLSVNSTVRTGALLFPVPDKTATSPPAPPGCSPTSHASPPHGLNRRQSILVTGLEGI
jgi:hypothetical protein